MHNGCARLARQLRTREMRPNAILLGFLLRLEKPPSFFVQFGRQSPEFKLP